MEEGDGFGGKDEGEEMGERSFARGLGEESV